MNASRLFVVALCVVMASQLASRSSRAQPPLSGDAWKQGAMVVARYEINGTGGRNNPLRHELTAPLSGEGLGDAIFVRYRIRYDAASLDSPGAGNGEFMVFWLDRSDGGDGATHSGVPNIGVHVAGNQNRFMIRFEPNDEQFGPALEGDRDYLVVAKLWKSSPGAEQPYDRLDLWVDPAADAQNDPAASVGNGKLNEIHWVGFSTGVKTEVSDRISLWDIDVASTWEAINGLPPPAELRQSPGPAAAPEKTVDFSSDVFPILQARCFGCHQGDDRQSEVRLDQLDEVLNQTTPRHAQSSPLYRLVAEGEMPPEGEPLDESQLAILRAWIDEGVQWDETLLPTAAPQSDHWAFQPIRRPQLPPVRDPAWVRSPVDAFIAAEQQRQGIQPAPEAAPHTLRRRLYLDLLGLPPQPQSIEPTDGEDGHDEFTNGGGPDEIDALLANPAYGERWGRHWLDVARWAESNGHQHNRARPHAWRYRDYVVAAFNDDKPLDVFIRQQIAGDQLEPWSDENLIATGFLAAARYSGNELDKAIQRNDILVDVVNTTGEAFLGLTLQCAQCHTHKFDPISIRDYYRFQAFFANAQPANVVLSQPEQDAAAQLAELPQTWGYYSATTAAHDWPVAPHEMRWPLPSDQRVLDAYRTHLLLRGDVTAPGPQVQPGWPALFGATPADLPKPRAALADWIATPQHPLTARVWVNRVWQWHFGRGLVPSSGDFGTQGTRPSHPQLLDFLAAELIDSGWSTKHIQRLIVNSATYRQSSRFSAANHAIDPENRLLWRWTPRRLEAEAVRDSMLAVSGQLDSTRGGPSVAITADSPRRSLYLAQHRDHFADQQQLFDSADGVTSCARRRVSTTPLQPLWLLNSPFMQSAAAALAERIDSASELIPTVLGRAAEPAEAQRLEALAQRHGLQSACLAVLNSSEFLYLP